MKISDIIIILLFIIPGIFAERISYNMDMPSSEKRSEFRELVNGILLSLPTSTPPIHQREAFTRRFTRARWWMSSMTGALTLPGKQGIPTS
jgi:hypothetical protein